ncbi:MAG: hypothetical protein NC222_06810 [Staphylococcus sp.]|nr:hypothetical protein [Staphylococcus sp.]
MAETKEMWYNKLWEVIKNVASYIWKLIIKVVKWFISVFNSWHKLSAIVLAMFAWNWLELSLFNKLGTFVLFGVMAVLIFDIANDAK